MNEYWHSSKEGTLHKCAFNHYFLSLLLFFGWIGRKLEIQYSRWGRAEKIESAAGPGASTGACVTPRDPIKQVDNCTRKENFRSRCTIHQVESEHTESRHRAVPCEISFPKTPSGKIEFISTFNWAKTIGIRMESNKWNRVKRISRLG